MLVKEGNVVQANQPLLRLDDTAVKAKLRRLVLRTYRLMATSARLEAEIHASDTLRVPAALANETSDPVVVSILQSQETELAAWRASLHAQEEVLKKEIAGLLESIRGYESQVTSNHARVALFGEAIKTKTGLLDQQLIRKSELLALQRSQASLSGELGELLGRIGDAKERSARADQQIVQLRSTAFQKAIEELHGAESELDDLQEQILAARDVVERTEVRAPVRGIVVKLNQHTPGGVVGPGAVILELLPINDELIIEARVNPTEITHVKEGQDALVRLSALNQRLTPMIEGKVIYLSAGIVSDQSARRASEPNVVRRDSFIVRVRLDERDLSNTTGIVLVGWDVGEQRRACDTAYRVAGEPAHNVARGGMNVGLQCKVVIGVPASGSISCGLSSTAFRVLSASTELCARIVASKERAVSTYGKSEIPGQIREWLSNGQGRTLGDRELAAHFSQYPASPTPGTISSTA